MVALIAIKLIRNLAFLRQEFEEEKFNIAAAYRHKYNLFASLAEAWHPAIEGAPSAVLSRSLCAVPADGSGPG